MSQSCIFCKIIRGELASSLVYQDDSCIAFLDIHPVNDGHVLVVPRRHLGWLCDLSDEEAGHLMAIGKKVLSAIRASGIRCQGANLFLSDGEAAGQEVPHTHLHIAPRFSGDGHRVGFFHSDPEQCSRDRLESIAGLIRRHMNSSDSNSI